MPKKPKITASEHPTAEHLGSYESPFRVLFYESGMGISLVDLERKILDINPAFERMIGYTKAELVGQTFAKILYPEDSPLNLELHRQLLSGERDIYHMDRRYVRKNGDIVWTHLTVSLLRDRQGKPELVMGVTEDITEQKKAEAKLAEQQAELAQAAKMSALGEMASGIAHEINNPLNVIQFRAQQLRQLAKGKGDAETLKKIDDGAENIEKNIGRITSIVKGLQAFARKGDQDPFEIVPIQRLFRDAEELCQDKFKYRGVDLKIKPIPAGMTLECRPTQILQVLVNLLNNAFDAVIDLKVRWVEVEAVQIREGILEINVTDSGNGIPEEIAKQMFTQFYTTKPAGKGTGLGLSISRKILEVHRGVLRLDRDSTKHTRFVLGLPTRQSASYFKTAA